jgi:hypothetical protein
MEPCNEQVHKYDACGISEGAKPNVSEMMADIGEAQYPAYRHNPSECESRCNVQEQSQPAQMVVTQQGKHYAYKNKREGHVRSESVRPEEITNDCCLVTSH